MVRGKVLITGASGYLGSRLSLYLSNSGFDVIALCNSSIPNDYDWTKSIYLIIQGDLRDNNTLREIESLNPEFIIHLVSLDHNKSGENITDSLQINVQTTWELLEISQKIKVNKFIYFSTVHVYGNCSLNTATENTNANPHNAYGLTHLLSENIVNYYNNEKNLNAASFRLSNSYGEPVFLESNSWNLAVNYICKSAFFHQKIVLKSDGTDLRDFIHFSSICTAIENVIKYNLHLDNVYNLCQGSSIRILDLALLVKNIFTMRYSKNVDIYINETTKIYGSSKDEVSNASFSNEKFNAILKIEYIGLDKGINQIFDYLEKNNLSLKFDEN